MYGLLLLTGLIISSCGSNNEGTETPKQTEGTEEGPVEKVQEEATFEIEQDDPSFSNFIQYDGFIGDVPITAMLEFNDDMKVRGSYYYNKYKKDLQLVGKEVDWFGGPIYDIVEFDANGDTTGYWDKIRYGFMDTYDGYFRTLEGKRVPIVLVPSSSPTYIDPNTQMLFVSESAAKDFYKKHHFLHNEAVNQQGLIVPNSGGYDYQILPVGLAVLGHNGADGFGVEPYGVIGPDNTIKLNSGEVVSIRDYCDYPETAVGYEAYAMRFERLTTSEYVNVVGTGYKEMYFKVSSLDSLGYHLEGDGYWLKEKSGQVMGYFPDYYSKDNNLYNYAVDVYSDKDQKEFVMQVVNDHDGFFLVNDAVYHNGKYLLNVTFDYFEQVPCSDEIREDKPSVDGWIEMYQEDPDTYLRHLVLGYYSKGC